MEGIRIIQAFHSPKDVPVLNGPRSTAREYEATCFRMLMCMAMAEGSGPSNEGNLIAPLLQIKTRYIVYLHLHTLNAVSMYERHTFWFLKTLSEWNET